MAYVYRHIRLDNGNPFYIGIGKDDSGKYSRAFSKDQRNGHWFNIVKKYGYEVEIMIDDISYDFAKIKEKEFILLYGRVNNNTGILCNKTDGGEGTCGLVVSEETRIKQSNAKKGKTPHNKGKKMPPNQLLNHGKLRKGKPAWNKGKKMSDEARRKSSLSKKGRFLGEKHPNWGKKMPDHVKEALRKYWKENPTPFNKGKKMTEEQLIKHTKLREKQMKIIIQKNLDGSVVKVHSSLGSAARELKCSKGTLSNACIKRGKLKTFRGFEWEYEICEKKKPLE